MDIIKNIELKDHQHYSKLCPQRCYLIPDNSKKSYMAGFSSGAGQRVSLEHTFHKKVLLTDLRLPLII